MRALCKVSARVLDVERDLALQYSDIGEFFLVPEFVQKIDFEMRAVNGAPEVEQMYFEAGARIARDRRSHAEACDPRQHASVDPVHFDRENTRQRRAVVLHQYVGGRTTQLAAEALAVDHASADALRAP